MEAKDTETLPEKLDKEEKLETLADLEAFLRSAGCRMTVFATGSRKLGPQWVAVISRNGFALATVSEKDFAFAIRKACAEAMAELQRMKDVVRC